MINNIEQIKSLLVFDSLDDFYHLQIIKRKKEHPELGSNSYVVKTYYIRSIGYLDKKWDEIMALCTLHNARGYINLNRRSFEKMAFHTLRKVTEQIMTKDFSAVRKAYESVCGTFTNELNRRWIVDIDVTDFVYINEVVKVVSDTEPLGDKLLALIPTKNGYHLITSPFRLDEFKKIYPELSIHKDNPTVLFIP